MIVIVLGLAVNTTMNKAISSMNTLAKFLQFLYSVYVMLVFVALMLAIFPFVLLVSVFGKIKGGNMIYRLCCTWADAWFLLTGMRSKTIYEDSVPAMDKRYIFVANHISYMDVPMIVKGDQATAARFGKGRVVESAGIWFFIPIWCYHG